MHTSIAKPHPCSKNLLDSLFYGGLIGSTELVSICPRVELDQRTGPPDRHLPISPDRSHRHAVLALLDDEYLQRVRKL